MIDYRIFINNGNENLGSAGKTISIEEKPRTISVDFLADAIHSQNELIPKRTVKEVLSIFGTVATRLMAEGLALQFQNDGDVLLRLYTDAKINGGNINLARARELTGDPTLTEDEMVSRAGELVGLAGVQLRAYAEVQQKFNELLKSYKPQPNQVGIVERAYVEKKNASDGGGTTEQPGGGAGSGSSSADDPGNEGD